MSAWAESKTSELPARSKQVSPNATKSPEDTSASGQTKTESSRKERRKDWWKKKNPASSEVVAKRMVPQGRGDNENSEETFTEQISKLRNRQTIAKPNSLQYEPNLNRGFHAKILHSLYNGPLKPKREKESAKNKNVRSKGKRKSNDTSHEQRETKKTKPDPVTPVKPISTAPVVQQPEYFDSYAFSMNLINGEVEKVKAQQNQKGKDSKNKYVLFVGNLPHDVTREQLEEHFRKTGGIKAIRIPRDKLSDKGRGFAYMEFDGRISHGIALRLHQTTLGGRKINVEFTSIGGGKSVARREKLRQKNRKRKKMKVH